jgi:hypothetical protein
MPHDSSVLAAYPVLPRRPGLRAAIWPRTSAAMREMAPAKHQPPPRFYI